MTVTEEREWWSQPLWAQERQDSLFSSFLYFLTFSPSFPPFFSFPIQRRNGQIEGNKNKFNPLPGNLKDVRNN